MASSTVVTFERGKARVQKQGHALMHCPRDLGAMVVHGEPGVKLAEKQDGTRGLVFVASRESRKAGGASA